MNTQKVEILSHDALDAVTGGVMMNNIRIQPPGPGALPRTGDAGVGQHGVDILSGLGSIGFLALAAFGFANASNSPL